MQPLDAQQPLAAITGIITSEPKPATGSEIVDTDGILYTVSADGIVTSTTERFASGYLTQPRCRLTLPSQLSVTLCGDPGNIKAFGAYARLAAHEAKMASKAALRADPAARAAQLAEINAPAHRKHRLAWLHTLALDLAAKKDLEPAETMTQASRVLAQIEHGHAMRTAAKNQRRARKYPENGKQEVARRQRQIAAGQIQVG